MIFFPLVYASGVPPSTRVNYRCYSTWDTSRDAPAVAWKGTLYSVEQLSGAGIAISDLSGTSAIWCTDCGVAGFQTISSDVAVVNFIWIEDPQVNVTRAVLATGSTRVIGGSTALGDTLYYLTHVCDNSGASCGPPLLNSMEFYAYSLGTPSTARWMRRLQGANVFSHYPGVTWIGYNSLLYPSGADAVTLSAAGAFDGSNFALDSVVRLSSTGFEQLVLVHAPESVMPSVTLNLREYITVPGLACRVSPGGVPLCHRLQDSGPYTWGSASSVVGGHFEPFGPEDFALPVSLWLASVHVPSGLTVPVLAIDGVGSALALSGGHLYSVESRPLDDYCERSILLSEYDITSDPLLVHKTLSLGCTVGVVRETAQPQTLVRWAGPWDEEFVLFLTDEQTPDGYDGPFHSTELNRPVMRASIARGVICEQGEEVVGGSCAPCTLGTYFNGSQQKCQDCPTGTYTTELRSRNCTQCATGRFTSNINSPTGMVVRRGASACVDCPAGYACNGSERTICNSGEYAPAKSSQCLQCREGTYSEAGASTCVNCPSGQWEEITYPGYPIDRTPVSTCVDCPAGYHCHGTKEKIQCPVDYYQDETGQRTCKQCPKGTTSYKGADSLEKCRDFCPVGTYTYGYDCLDCQRGTYNNATNQTKCTPCPAGRYNNDTRGESLLACKLCPMGTYGMLTGMTKCTQCPDGTYSNTTGADLSIACRECPNGTIPNEDKSGCVECPAGTYKRTLKLCYPCEPGTYASKNGTQNCAQCPRGKYQDESGQLDCKDCPVGYGSLPGSTDCKQCSAGQYSDTAGAGCRTCISGTYQDEVGQTSCKECPAGTYRYNSSLCVYCTPGFWSTPGSVKCLEKCPPGMACHDGSVVPCTGTTYSSGGFGTCYNCTGGREYVNTEHTACLTCDDGLAATPDHFGCTSCVGTLKDGVCSECPAGTYGPTGEAGCLPCPDATWSTPGSLSCDLSCPEAHYCVNGTMTPCPVGTYSTGGLAECTPCEPGTYQGKEGQTGCDTCDVGHYTDKPGMSECPFCPDGLWSDIDRFECNQCLSGYACHNGVMEACEGDLYAGPGAAKCGPCPGGYNCTNSASTPCPAGMYSPEGATSCSPCSSKKYSERAWERCKTCPAFKKCENGLMQGTSTTSCLVLVGVIIVVVIVGLSLLCSKKLRAKCSKQSTDVAPAPQQGTQQIVMTSEQWQQWQQQQAWAQWHWMQQQQQPQTQQPATELS